MFFFIRFVFLPLRQYCNTNEIRDFFFVKYMKKNTHIIKIYTSYKHIMMTRLDLPGVDTFFFMTMRRDGIYIYYDDSL